MLYMFRTPFASIFRSTINCNSSHWCHELGWNKSCVDVKVGEHCTIPRQNVTFWPWNSTVLTDLDIYTGFIPTQLMTPVAAVTVYSAPDDRRKGRPKHVEHTCSFNKHNTARVASCWFIIHVYYRLVMHGNSNIKKCVCTSSRFNVPINKADVWGGDSLHMKPSSARHFRVNFHYNSTYLIS